MAEDVEVVELGTGKVFLNAIDVGYLSGDVTTTLKQTMVDYKPSSALSPVKSWPITEEISIKASSAELSAKNLKLAMGTTTAVQEGTSFPAFDPSSYSADASASWNILTFGGSREVDYLSLRYEGTRQNGKKYGMVLYRVKSNKDLTLAFKEKDVIIYDLAFMAMAITTRPEGDQVGFWYEEV